MSIWVMRRANQYSGLRKLIAGLKEVAGGEVVARSIDRFADYLNGRIHGELERHIDTGLALRTAEVAFNTKTIEITLQRYRRYIKWSFKKGIPISALNRGKKIFREEIERALKVGS